MPLNEAKTRRRERWPLSMDLEGVPRDPALRERLLQPAEPPLSFEETEEQEMPRVNNTFAVDYKDAENVVDINNPPRKNYRHQEFPKMVYNHDSGHVLTVKTAKELQAALRKGFQERPAGDRDYSKVKSGFVAPKKEHFEPREEALSVEDEEALEQSDQEDAELDNEAEAGEADQAEPVEEEQPAARRTAKKKAAKGRR